MPRSQSSTQVITQVPPIELKRREEKKEDRLLDAEEKDWPFLERAKTDLAQLRLNYDARYTYRASTLAMVNSVQRYINEAKRDGYDDALHVTYKNFRDMTRNWYWGDDLYAIFNNTLDDIEEGRLARQKRLSDPELVRENQRLQESIRLLRRAQQENAQAKRRLERTVKQKSVIISRLSGGSFASTDSPETLSPLGSPPLSPRG